MRGKIFKQDVRMFALFGLMLLPISYLCYTGKLGSQWHLNPILLFVLLAGMLLLSATEIPMYVIRTKKPDFSEDANRLLSELYSVPVADELKMGENLVFNTAITANLGGFILPLILAAYAAITNPSFVSLEIMLIIVIATHLLLEIQSCIGFVIPDYIGLLSIPFALILDPANAATIVLVSGVIGILIGMAISLLNINANTNGSAFINLGGVGNFKAVYITVLIASLLTYSAA